MHKIWITGVILILLLAPQVAAQPVAGETTIDNGIRSLTITILDSFYTNADNDTFEDDIITYFRLDIEYYKEIEPVNYVCFDLYITLELPSGGSHTYAYRIATNYEHLNSTMYFYNHATETGWYTVSITGILYGPTRLAYGTEEFSFDPPGGTDGTEPGASLKLIGH